MTPCPICGGIGEHYGVCREVGKPDGYPLPWCDALGMPYWQANMILCLCRDGWIEWQRGRPLEVIIPEIDRAIERMGEW